MDWRESFTFVAVSRLWDRLGTTLWVGFLGFALSLTVVLAPPALAAAADAAVRGVRQEEFGLKDFFDSGRRFFIRSWALFALLLIALTLIFFNLRFYSMQEGIFWTLAFSVTLTLLVVFAWLIFAILLTGRHLMGWRGRKVVYWTFTGLLLLIVAAFGTQLAMEYLS